MEVLPLLHLLWRRRLALAVGAIAAIALAFVVGSGGSTSSGFASTRIVLDTPTSQVVDADPTGADSLAWRASLLTHLLARETVTRELADRLGLRPDQLAVVDRGLGAPQAPASLPESASEAAFPNGALYVLTAYLEDEALPIVTLDAQAPDRAGAQRLADAGAAALKAEVPAPGGELDTAAESAAQLQELTAVPRGRQGLVVEDVGTVRAKTVVASADPIKAVGPPLFLLVLWTGCVLLGPLLVRAVRQHGRLRTA